MKYIIEFEDEYSMNEGGMKYHQCKQVPYWSVSHGIIKNLTPYTEPDRKAIEDEVWKLADTIHGMIIQDKMSCFGFSLTSAVTSNLSYQEAKAKYEAWFKQKDEIRVGDEVKHRGRNYVVGYVGADKVYHLIDENWLRTVVQGGYQLIKTGRHFPEVAQLLDKMRGEEQ